jgi:deoxycytidine triphosphate deaminase
MIISDEALKTRLITGSTEVREAKEWWKDAAWDRIANRIIIDPFQDHRLGPCCYGLSVGDEYVSLRDPFNPRPLKKGEHISIGPSETVLVLSQEYLCLPRNALAMIVPRATWIFEGISLSSTRIDPTWYGKLLIGVTNLAKNPVALDWGEEFCTCYFMEATEAKKVLSRETQSALGRDTIGTVRLAHAKPQHLMLPGRVSRDDIDKVVELYGWPWDVVRGMFELTKKEVGDWIEKEVASDIVTEATSAAAKDAFDKMVSQVQEQGKWIRGLSIALITVCATIGVAVLAAVVTYLVKSFS